MSEYNSGEQPDEAGADVSHRTLFLLERLNSLAHVVVAGFFLLLAASVLVAAIAQFFHGVRAAFGPEVEEPAKLFIVNCLEVLSTVLFAVIILELLRTIITYLQSHDIRAIMKEFLIVGIISSIRKILMIGAQASMDKGAEAASLGGNAFVQESAGVVLSVIAILLMIGGLIVLNKYYGEHGGHAQG